MNYERLLNVARALREAKNPDDFDMEREIYSHCGAPACAFGHYAGRRDLQDEFYIAPSPRHDGTWVIRAKSWPGSVDVGVFNPIVEEHFESSWDDLETIFNWQGCGGAQTPVEAAEFIEKFVRDRKGPS